MTPEEREAVRALVVAPGGHTRMSSDDFLERFGAVDGRALGVNVLGDAVKRRDAVDVELALVIGFRFGFSEEHLKPLLELCYADWHHAHEDVVTALGKLRSPDSVEALLHMAQWVPSYLEYDDSRALAKKAIWALGAVDGAAAEQALSTLARSADTIVAGAAAAQIERRGRDGSREFMLPR